MAFWPTEDDLSRWVGEISPEMEDLLDEIIEEAISLAKKKVNAKLMPEDPDDCPPELHRAIVIDGARIYSRVASQNGVIGAAELALRVGKSDPDYKRIMRSFRLVDA